MTEKQAAECWCPFGDTAGNRQEPCIASRCMAWRWSVPLFDGPDSYRAEPGPTGYCGLASRPVELDQ